ncbi:mitochondrial large ribosomal subunit [Dimargaris verticillata]|uniref:Large ribosomal subunit protein mL49 n=1 Tax=Dimargaris verticillata TaxID=2761393 RepID=A0A9W8B0V0_9FUNG|nr:mitochondrial large ribosomal subunit [Dimargaris verticillata]
MRSLLVALARPLGHSRIANLAIISPAATTGNRQVSTAAPAPTLAATAPPSATASKASESLSTLRPQPTSSTKDLPYVVVRTANQALPVYSDYRNGNTRVLTIIRRVWGDKDALCRDLAQVVPVERLSVRKVTGHIWIKGFYRNEIIAFLAKQGF